MSRAASFKLRKAARPPQARPPRSLPDMGAYVAVVGAFIDSVNTNGPFLQTPSFAHNYQGLFNYNVNAKLSQFLAGPLSIHWLSPPVAPVARVGSPAHVPVNGKTGPPVPIVPDDGFAACPWKKVPKDARMTKEIHKRMNKNV